MEVYELKITDTQLEYLIESVKELIEKTKAEGNMLIRAEELMYNDYKINMLEILLNYLEAQ